MEQDSLIQAIEKGDLERFKGLVGAVDMTRFPTLGELMVAASRRESNYMKVLVQAGVNVNLQNSKGDAPLIMFAASENVEMVEFLLAHGADPNIRQGSTITALTKVAMRRSRKGVEIATKLIGAGADPNFIAFSVKGIPNATILIFAVRANNPEVVRLLISSGARVNEIVAFGTALTCAVQEGHAEIVQMLLDAGADRDLRVPETGTAEAVCKTAIELAQIGKLKQVVQLLQLLTAGRPKPATITEAWHLLECELSEKNPQVLKTFRLGLGDDEITQCESMIAQKLPSAVRESMKYHDGQNDHPDAAFITTDNRLVGEFRLLSAKEIIEEWKIWMELVADGEFTGQTSLPDPGVRDDWFNAGWIPITSNGSGDHHCLDLNPARGGNVGQIILAFHDQYARPKVASTLAEWLRIIGYHLGD